MNRKELTEKLNQWKDEVADEMFLSKDEICFLIEEFPKYVELRYDGTYYGIIYDVFSMGATSNKIQNLHDEFIKILEGEEWDFYYASVIRIYKKEE